MTDNNWDGKAEPLTKIYLKNNLPLSTEMKQIIKDKNRIIHIDDLSIDRLLEISKYVTDSDIALDIALKLKKAKREIPENIKKLMTKASYFHYYLKDFEDIGYDSDSFMKNLEKDSYAAESYLREHGVEGLSEKAVLNIISQEYWLRNLIRYYLEGTLGEKYDDALIKKISKKILSENSAHEELFNLIEKFGENLPSEILSAILKNKKVLRNLYSSWKSDKMKFPKSIEDAMVESLIEEEDFTTLYYFLKNTKKVDPRLLNHYMQDIKKAVNLYHQILRAELKAPSELVDMIAARGRISYKVYEKLKHYGYKLDKEILDSANAYIQKKMDKE